MSVLLERYECPVGDCEFVFRGEPSDVKYARREHELVHDVDEEGGAYLAENAEEAKPERHIGSPAPIRGKTVEQIDAEYRDAQLGQVVTVRCADCLFEETGPQAQARRAWARHRRDEHHDDQVEAIERSLAGIRIRRTSTGRRAISQNVNKLDEHVQKTRLEGGGHGVSVQETNGLTRWTREKAIEGVKVFHARHGRIPTQMEFRKANGLPASAWVQREFGGLAKLMEVCGFEPNYKGGTHSRRPRASVSSSSNEEPEREAVPPPASEPAKGHSEGQKKPPIEPEPAPAQTSEGTPEGTLVELAKAVEEARTRLTQAQSALDAAVDAMRDALEEVAA